MVADGGLLFGWVGALTATGWRRQLRHDDLPPEPPGASPRECVDALWREWWRVRCLLLASKEGGWLR